MLKKYTPRQNGFIILAGVMSLSLSGQQSGQQLKPKINLVPFLSRPFNDYVNDSFTALVLFNLLVKFVSFRHRQFEVRLVMAQGHEPNPVENSPDPYRSLEQSGRDYYTSREG